MFSKTNEINNNTEATFIDQYWRNDKFYKIVVKWGPNSIFLQNFENNFFINVGDLKKILDLYEPNVDLSIKLISMQCIIRWGAEFAQLLHWSSLAPEIISFLHATDISIVHMNTTLDILTEIKICINILRNIRSVTFRRNKFYNLLFWQSGTLP